MHIYDEENINFDEADDEMSGYTVIEENSIFQEMFPEKDPETIATPIPENEQTVILCEPDVARLKDGDVLSLDFGADNSCNVLCGDKKIGYLKSAYVRKLKADRGEQLASVFFKLAVPPMIRIKFGEGAPIPAADPEI